MDIYGNKLVNTIETKPLCASSSDLSNQFLCRLRSIAAHRDHFVRRLSVCACVCLSDSHTFLIVTHSYVSQATHAFLGMLSLCCICKRTRLICITLLVQALICIFCRHYWVLSSELLVIERHVIFCIRYPRLLQNFFNGTMFWHCPLNKFKFTLPSLLIWSYLLKCWW